MKIAVVASGTPAEVRCALALAEELARRMQLRVRVCGGDSASLSEALRDAFAEARMWESDGARTAQGLRVLESPSAVGVVEVGHDGRWFCRHGKRVDLSSRRVLMRVLWTLARARVESPDRSVAVEEVAAVVWPNERMQRTSADNRVRVALSTLRRLGLRGVLLSRSRGVLLDPGVDLALVSNPSAAPEPATRCVRR
ncbi:MAG: hypothetical protein ABW252_03605 [Polyangiales bacterium]